MAYWKHLTQLVTCPFFKHFLYLNLVTPQLSWISFVLLFTRSQALFLHPCQFLDYFINVHFHQELGSAIFHICYTYSLGDPIQCHICKCYPYTPDAIIYSSCPTFLLHFGPHISYWISIQYFNLNIAQMELLIPFRIPIKITPSSVSPILVNCIYTHLN